MMQRETGGTSGLKMRVLMDPQVFYFVEVGGIQRVFAELYRHFPRDGRVEVLWPSWFGSNWYAQRAGMPQRTFITRARFRGKGRLSKLLNRYSFARTHRRTCPNLVHPTFYDTDFLQEIGDTPVVVTVHDMLSEAKLDKTCGRNYSHRQGKRIRQNKRILVERAGRIIVVSNATKAALLQYFDVNPHKIDVIYPASSLSPRKQYQTLPPVVPRPYILFVGGRRPYKNFPRFAAAVAPILRCLGVRLLCAGRTPFSLEEKQMLSRLGIGDRVDRKLLSERALCRAY